MKRLIVLLMTMVLLVLMISPALADGTKDTPVGRVVTKQTIDNDGGVTVSSSTEIPGTEQRINGIAPKGGSYLETSTWCLAECYRNLLTGWVSSKSRAYTSSDKKTLKPISEIETIVEAYDPDDGQLCESNADRKTNSSQAYCGTFVCEILLSHETQSAHHFHNGGASWSPTLRIPQ